MNELDQMLQAPKEAVPPLVRYCKQHVEAGDRVEIELWQADESSRTFLVVHCWEKGQEQELQHDGWDDGVNGGLLDLGVRAINLEQEGERFALAIRSALRKIERWYGDGYLNTVLIDFLEKSEFRSNAEIDEVMKYIHVNSPDPGRSYRQCRELIVEGIKDRVVELRDKLKYGPQEVRDVMARAIAVYLDRRFSVSDRRRFGLLS